MIPEVLGERGWNTYIVGKWHLVPRGRDEHGLDEEGLAARPRVRALLRLPRRRDEPVVSRPRPTTTTPVEQPKLPEDGYHFSVDITDKALSFIKDAKVVAPDKPFFLYYALGRRPRAAPRAQGVGRQVQGQVRHGLRGLPRARLREPEEARDHPRARRALADQPVHRPEGPDGQGLGRRSTSCVPGTRSATTRSTSSPAWPRSTPAS